MDEPRDQPREPDVVRDPDGVDPARRPRRAGLGLPCPECGLVSTGWSVELAERRPLAPMGVAIRFVDPPAVLAPCGHVVSRDELDVMSTPTFPTS